MKEIKPSGYLQKMINSQLVLGSFWELVRQRQERKENIMQIWEKGIPFKISFIMWRLWHMRIPIGEVLVRMKITNEVECCCCDTRVPEIVDHLFIQCSMFKSVWKLFAEAAGIQRTLIHLRQVIDSWWNATCCSKLKPLLKAIPSFII